jgi:allantoinase
MSMKADADFFKVWGGISGCQHLLSLLFELGLPIAQLAAGNVADRFGLAATKGRIVPGMDADLVLLDQEPHTAAAESLHYRHPHSPYLGRILRARVRRTMLRGRTVFLDGRLVGEPRGRFLAARRDR